jgi:phage baseplate assembly protein gpV
MNKSGIITSIDCKECPAKTKCDDLRSGIRIIIELGDSNCQVLRTPKMAKEILIPCQYNDCSFAICGCTDNPKKCN